MGTNGMGVHKHIRRGWDSVSNFVSFEVGIGSKVNFWHDIWCDDRPSMFFQLCSLLLGTKMHGWRINFNGMMGLLNGKSFLCDKFRIGRWSWY